MIVLYLFFGLAVMQVVVPGEERNDKTVSLVKLYLYLKIKDFIFYKRVRFNFKVCSHLTMLNSYIDIEGGTSEIVEICVQSPFALKCLFVMVNNYL
jgi:hypothetical protein